MARYPATPLASSYGTVFLMGLHHTRTPSVQSFVHSLRNALQSFTFSEASVLSVVIGTRKVIELSPPQSYEVVKLFCDWAAHTAISQGTNRIRRFFEAFDIEEGMSMQQWFTSKYFEEFVLLRGFRSALAQFLKDKSLPTSLVDNDQEWFGFVYLYAGVVAGTPIVDVKNGVLPDEVAELQLDRVAEPATQLQSLRVRVTLKDGREYFSMHLLPLRRFLAEPIYQYQLQKFQ